MDNSSQKTLSDLRKQFSMLAEDSDFPVATGGSTGDPNGNGIDDGSIAMFDVESDKTIAALNAYIGQLAARTYLNPETPIHILRRKLETVGYGFKFTGFQTLPPAVVEWPLTLFGGRFGQLDSSSYEIGSDDNISNKLGHGLLLRLNFAKNERHEWVITGKIIPSNV